MPAPRRSRSRSRSRSRNPAAQLAELSLAAPQVVAHRLTRMALAGPVLSARDRKEFTGMVAEKQLAFAQSWLGMWTEMARQQQRLYLSWFALAPAVAAAGLAPVHRKAVTNSRRLARTRLR